eukprot:751790-Hanusia_phi.AAC.1
MAMAQGCHDRQEQFSFLTACKENVRRLCERVYRPVSSSQACHGVGGPGHYSKQTQTTTSTARFKKKQIILVFSDDCAC